MPKLEATIGLGRSLELSLAHQQKLKKDWNDIVSDPYAFTPHEKKGSVSLDEVLAENVKLGEFASGQLKEIFSKSSPDDVARRLKEKKKIVAVGFGRNYDSLWLKEATLAGLETWWLDVSDVACSMARISMKAQWEKLGFEEGHYPVPVVKQGEVRSLLLDPGTIGLDLELVEIWYFCRTLTCLSERSAGIVLQKIGSSSLSRMVDPSRHHKVVIVSALRDNNPTRKGRSSKLYTKKKILAHLAKGVEQPVRAEVETTHLYFDQVYTGMTIGVTP